MIRAVARRVACAARRNSSLPPPAEPCAPWRPPVSDRGDIRESCLGAGFVLPLSPELTVETRVPVGPAAVAGWLALIERLADDEAFYRDASARAMAAGRAFAPEVLGPCYLAFFEGVLAAPADAGVLI